MPRSSERSHRLTVILALVLAGMVIGCSNPDLYLDRRETITLGAGDAVASNIVAQTIDPWPRVAGNRDIESNGEKMQGAVERYRTNKVTPLRALSTSSVEFSQSNSGNSSGGLTK